MKLIEDIIREHFTKLFLLIVFGVLTWIGAHATMIETKTWAMTQGATILGYIGALATREVLAKRNGKSPTVDED